MLQTFSRIRSHYRWPNSNLSIFKCLAIQTQQQKNSKMQQLGSSSLNQSKKNQRKYSKIGRQANGLALFVFCTLLFMQYFSSQIDEAMKLPFQMKKNYYLMYVLMVFVLVWDEIQQINTMLSVSQSGRKLLGALFGAYRKQNIYLMVFLLLYVGDNANEPFKSTAILIASLFMCGQCYFRLVFHTVRLNSQYFLLFFAVLCLHACRMMAGTLGLPLELQKQAVVVILAVCAAAKFMEHRLDCIAKSDPKTLKGVQILIAYFQLMMDRVTDSTQTIKYVFYHSQKCLRLECFCHRYVGTVMSCLPPEQLDHLRYQVLGNILWQYLENSQAEAEDRFQLVGHYLGFLTHTKQLPKAAVILNRFVGMLGWSSRCRHWLLCEELLQSCYRPRLFEPHHLKLRSLLEYDTLAAYVGKEVQDILMAKVLFWLQLSKKQVVLKDLQELGNKVIQKSQELHKYFTQEILKIQELLGNFRCSQIYATYLMKATNFTEFGKSLLKKMNKAFQQDSLKISSCSEFVMVVDLQREYSKECTHDHRLVIANISHILCFSLNRDKKELLSENINILIPAQLHAIHEKQLGSLVNGSKSELIRDYIHSSAELPFVHDFNQVVYFETNMSVTYNLASNRMSFHCILHRKSSHEAYFIVDQNKQIVYQQKNCSQTQINKKIVGKLVDELLTAARKDRQNTQNQTTYYENGSSVKIKCQLVMPAQLALQDQCVLIKVSASGSQINVRQFAEPNLESLKEIRIEKTVIRQNDSQDSNVSSSSSLSSTLLNITQKNSLRFEPLMTVLLLLIAVSATAGFLGLYSFFHIWDASVSENSPPYTIVALLRLQSLLNQGLGWYYDILKAESANQDSYQSLYQYLYGQPMEVAKTAVFQVLYKHQMNIINNYLVGSNNELNPSIRQFLSQGITLQSSNKDQQQIQLSLQSILISYVSDAYSLMEGSNQKRILQTTYLSQAYAPIEDILASLEREVESIVQYARSGNQIMLILILLFLVALLPCYLKVINKSKSKRLMIYNILGQLHCGLVNQEIQKLSQIEYEVTSYNINRLYFPPTQHQLGNLRQQAMYKSTATRKLRRQNNRHYVIAGFHEPSRKKQAEIIIQGSSCDRFQCQKADFFLLLFVILFAATCGFVVFEKEKLFNSANQTRVSTLELFTDSKKQSFGLLVTKIYVDEYHLNTTMKFMGEDIQPLIQQFIKSFTKLLEYNQETEAEARSCNSQHILCRIGYSNNLLTGMVKAAVSNAYGYQRQVLRNPKASDPEKAVKLRQALVLAQAAVDRTREIRLSVVVDRYSKLEQVQRRYWVSLRMIYRVFLIVLSLFVVASALFCRSLKHRYLRELTLLTLLNRSMLYNNKSVKSFLHNLAKSLR